MVLFPGLCTLIIGAALWGAEDHTGQLETDLSQTPMILLILGGVLTFLGLLFYLIMWLRHMPRRKRKDETAKSRPIQLKSIYIPQEVIDDATSYSNSLPPYYTGSLPTYSAIFNPEGAGYRASYNPSGNYDEPEDSGRNSYKAALGNPVYNTHGRDARNSRNGSSGNNASDGGKNKRRSGIDNNAYRFDEHSKSDLRYSSAASGPSHAI